MLGLSFNRPIIMGIVNVTPDSFSDGGCFSSNDDIVFHIDQLIKHGADIIDIGAQSTRPGAALISVQEEIDRLSAIIPFFKQRFDCLLSLDTFYADVAKFGLEHGVDLVNDGDVDDSDSYLKNRRKAIGKAMKKEEVEIEEQECWDTHKKVGMKKKGNKMVNDCRPKNESFNVKSPVVFSKPEEEVEESISEEVIEKHASSIFKAHKSIQK